MGVIPVHKIRNGCIGDTTCAPCFADNVREMVGKCAEEGQ